MINREVALQLFATATFVIDHLATLVLGTGGGTFNDKMVAVVAHDGGLYL